jgi:hypothetical protein
MPDNLREQLHTEITRKQFLQYLTGAVLMVLGLHNLVALLTGNKVVEKRIFMPGASGDMANGFGSRRFGT